jgi:hypothetical protein
MTLGAPWMLSLLPLVVLAAWLTVRARRLQREAACQLKGAAHPHEKVALSRRDWLALAALACIVFALARPQWNPRPYNVERRGRDLVFALDVSRSMLAADLSPNRLELARIVVHEALPAFAGQRVALVTFAGSASVKVPLTLDHGFVRYMLERADPSDVDVGSTSLQAAFEKVTSSVLADARGQRDLIVFTDGEDHLSDLERTTELLSQSGARVLIIGVGDPVQGARVPDTRGDGQWMHHRGMEVVSRLQEDTLVTLAEESPNVNYYPARTQPFDLLTLYQQLVEGAGNDVTPGELRQIRYTEGYPYLLALSVALWLLSTVNLREMRTLFLLTLLFPGCGQPIANDGEAAFQATFKQGSQLLKFAEEQSTQDPAAEQSLLLDAREQFLRAALLQPGHVETARQITTVTRRLRDLQAAIEQQRAEQEQQREKLTDTVRRLQNLTVQQKRLSQQSRRILRRRPTLSQEQLNNPELLQLPAEQLNDLAPPVATEQEAVCEATAIVLQGVTEQRNTLREILKRAYGNIDKLPPTEVDPVVDHLAATVAAQKQALAHLAPRTVSWPKANTALHTAAGRMQQSLDALQSLLPPKTDEEEETPPSRNEGDAKKMDDLDSEVQGNQSRPSSPGDFQDALSLKSLPIPDYTSAEILAEESANQQKRSRRQADRAGARVEKNW